MILFEVRPSVAPPSKSKQPKPSLSCTPSQVLCPQTAHARFNCMDDGLYVYRIKQRAGCIYCRGWRCQGSGSHERARASILPLNVRLGFRAPSVASKNARCSCLQVALAVMHVAQVGSLIWRATIRGFKLYHFTRKQLTLSLLLEAMTVAFFWVQSCREKSL